MWLAYPIEPLNFYSFEERQREKKRDKELFVNRYLKSVIKNY